MEHKSGMVGLTVLLWDNQAKPGMVGNYDVLYIQKNERNSVVIKNYICRTKYVDVIKKMCDRLCMNM